MSAPRRSDRRPRRLVPALGALVLAHLASGCFDTQRYPGILEPQIVPLPDGAKSAYERGPEEAFVIRHADPVGVRVAESNEKYDLAFYDKRTRVPAGSWVFTGAQAHAEVLLAGATQITLRGRCSGVVGSESRREPVFRLIDVGNASVTFGESGQVQLPGGAVLEGDTGPFVVESVRHRIVRVRNRSGGIGRIAYRDSIVTIEPSESVDLALLEGGTVPYEVDPSARAVLSEAGRLQLRGEVDVLASDDGTLLRSSGTGQVEGLGLTLDLGPGDEVRVLGLGSSAPR
ncbi:MAG: hypothetical protein AAF726_09220 [Planctomycetota bacterium]